MCGLEAPLICAWLGGPDTDFYTVFNSGKPSATYLSVHCSVLPPHTNFNRKATACQHSFIPICADSIAVSMVILMFELLVKRIRIIAVILCSRAMKIRPQRGRHMGIRVCILAFLSILYLPLILTIISKTSRFVCDVPLLGYEIKAVKQNLQLIHLKMAYFRQSFPPGMKQIWNPGAYLRKHMPHYSITVLILEITSFISLGGRKIFFRAIMLIVNYV